MFQAPNTSIKAASLPIAIDAMGGDHAPDAIIAGAAEARIRYPQLKFLIYGDEARVRPLLDAHPLLKASSELRHTPDIVGSAVKPSIALRQGKNSSMRLAIDAVANGEAAAVVSAGNTGALLAMAMLSLRTLPGIDRPAIATMLPTQRGECVMLDLGANVECKAENYVQFALMGAIFARTALGILSPLVGLLNIGSEEMKGHAELQEANVALRDMALAGSYVGFVEGNDIPAGKADVVVTDGFSGNIALKVAEGTAKLVTHFIRVSFRRSLLASLGYLFAYGAFKRLKQRLDPRRYNGAMFLGLSGICVKSHGGTDALGFANAIAVAVDLVGQGYIDKIRRELARFETESAKTAAPATTSAAQ